MLLEDENDLPNSRGGVNPVLQVRALNDLKVKSTAIYYVSGIHFHIFLLYELSKKSLRSGKPKRRGKKKLTECVRELGTRLCFEPPKTNRSLMWEFVANSGSLFRNDHTTTSVLFVYQCFEPPFTI